MRTGGADLVSPVVFDGRATTYAFRDRRPIARSQGYGGNGSSSHCARPRRAPRRPSPPNINSVPFPLTAMSGAADNLQCRGGEACTGRWGGPPLAKLDRSGAPSPPITLTGEVGGVEVDDDCGAVSRPSESHAGADLEDPLRAFG
jgi:hypothetical protein